MIENRKNYRLDVDKIKTLKDVKNVLDNLHFIGYYDADDPNDENYYLSEYFTIPQERQGLTFSTPRKSIEELSQELEEKIDILIAKTIAKFECSKETAEYYYNERFDRIFSNFHYAKEHGHFPIVRIAKTGRIDYAKLSVSGEYTPSFVVKQGKKHDGYYTNGNRRYFKYYMPNKPNMIVRFFMRTCLGFYWVDEKDT